MPKMRVVFHHMPQHRTVTDRNHRLRNTFRVFAQPHAVAAAEQHDLHEETPRRKGEKLSKSIAEESAARTVRPTGARSPAGSRSPLLDSREESTHNQDEFRRSSLARTRECACRGGIARVC